jgi:hypothetical protein
MSRSSRGRHGDFPGRAPALSVAESADVVEGNFCGHSHVVDLPHYCIQVLYK